MSANSGLCVGFARQNLRWKRERVDEKKPGEFFELFDFSSIELVVVVCTLIPVKTDKVCPFLQIERELSTIRKEINSFCQHLACKRWIKLARSCVNSLSEHGSGRISIASASVIETLHERTFDCLGNTCRRCKAILLGIFENYRRLRLLDVPIEVTRESSHPSGVVGGVEEADARNLAAPVAGKHCRASGIPPGH